MRKLATACGAFSLAAFLAHYALPASWLFPLALCLALPGIALILLRRRWLLPVILALCGLAAGFYAYGMHRMLTLDRARALDGQDLPIEAQVLAVPEQGSGYVRAEVLAVTEGGVRLRGIYYDHSGLLAGAAPGDTLVVECRIYAADTRYGERYDNDLARGVYLTLNARGTPELRQGRRSSLQGLASRVHAALAERIKAVFPADTAAFFRALLLGDKTDLYEDEGMSFSLSRAGLMHMVAVSGMHVVYLVGMLRQVFGNKRRTAALAILLVWAFVLLTGGSPSAVRAAVMQTVVLLAPILGRENDPPTSLLFALALILLGNPFAAGSVSLQLSFSAMAGILLLSEPLSKRLLERLPKRLPFRLRRYLASNIANSIGVLVLSTPLIGYYFGYVSVLSPLTNLLCLWAVPICFCGGYLCCLFSLLSLPLARLAAGLLSWLGRWILWVAGRCSALGFSTLYLCLKANILWVLLVYVLFAIAFILWRGGWMRWVFPTGLAILSLFVLLTVTRLYYSGLPGMMTAVDVGQGQSLVVFSGARTVVVDCGNVNSRDDAGDLTGAYLLSRGRERVDCLVLTHLHTDHADGVLRLLEYLPVEEIVLGPDMDDPNGLLPAIEAEALRRGTRLRILHRDQTLHYDALTLQLFIPPETGDINERCLWARIGVDGYELLVTGDSDQRTERALLQAQALGGTEVLIVGHHGSKFASSDELLSALGADTAVISCGYNTYGHPTQETLARLAEHGYTVYRTDRDGTVELPIP